MFDIVNFLKLSVQCSAWQKKAKLRRTNSRTNCQQNKITVCHLCHFIALSRRGCDKHSVSKNNVRKLCIPQHLVIGWEAMGEGWVKTCYHPVLCCHDHCMCCTVWGYHSSSGQDLGVN